MSNNEGKIATNSENTIQNTSTITGPEDIYIEFRSACPKSFEVPYIGIAIGVLLLYLILFFIFRFKLDHNNLTCIPLIVKNILIFLMPGLCGIYAWKSIRNDTKAEKTKFISLAWIIWIVFIISMLFLKGVPRKIVLLFDLFFFLLFIISLIDYESANYTDSEKDKAKTILLDIVNNKGLDNGNPYFYDLLVNYSNDIEDSLVSAIRKFKNWVNVLFIGSLFSANIEVLKGLFKSIDEFTLELSIEVFFYQIFMADFFLVTALLFFAGYKFSNWKSNLYKTILKEIQFTFVIKKELKLQERR
jgi:membrane protein